jgi:hypothetical protein
VGAIACPPAAHLLSAPDGLDDFTKALLGLTIKAQEHRLNLATVLAVLDEQAKAMRCFDDRAISG